MMSYEAIRDTALKAQRRAQSRGRKPKTFVGLGHDAIRDGIRSIPFLGKNKDESTYEPKGWKRVDVDGPRGMGCEKGYLFVDACGMGSRNEPALTVGEFVEFIYDNKHLGYGIVEAGQFQVVIACYERAGKESHVH